MRDLNFLEGFTLGAARCEGKTEFKVFDWDKAAKIIARCKPEVAYAGLQGDFSCTGGEIYRDGEPVMNDYTHLQSLWATPVLRIDGEDTPCYVTYNKGEEFKWDSDTKWPQSALD